MSLGQTTFVLQIRAKYDGDEFANFGTYDFEVNLQYLGGDPYYFIKENEYYDLEI